MTSRHALRALSGWLVLSLAVGCSSNPAGPPPPPPPPPPSGIGAAGGTVTGPSGAEVSVPAGALSANTAIAVAQSNAGAPAVPTGMTSFGQMFAFTPHGTTFAVPVTVKVPYDPGSVPAGRTPILYKTTSGQAGWERVTGATASGGLMTAQVTGFSFFVVGSAPPTISQQPQNAAVTEPAAAGFAVTALGTPPFSYQWQRSADQGVTWANAPGASATAASYSTGPTTVAADDQARYRVVVSNPDGPTTSAVVTLTVAAAVAAPVITGQPQNQTVTAGANATFTVVATGAGLAYQWQRAAATGSFTDIAGATNPSYTLTGAQAADNGARFQVVVSNGGGTVTSNPATLTVGAAPQPIPPGPYLAAGLDFSLARSPVAGLVSWGSDASGQLGAGIGNQSRSAPASVGVTNAVSIAAGGLHGLLVRSTGAVMGWGYNTFGQVGVGGSAPLESPVAIGTMASGSPIDHAVAVCGGTLHSLILRSTAPYVLAMGYNGDGQLGDGTTTDRPLPVPILNRPVQAIACGGNFSLALADGEILAWGANGSGQLGNGTTVASKVPVTVGGLGGPNAVAIAAGTDHALVRLGNGQVWGWGSNLNGKLGPNGPTSGPQVQTTPVLVGGLPTGTDPVLWLAAGGENSAVVTQGGSVYVWGINETGQLGRGSLNPGFDPVPRTANLPTSCVAREVAVGRKGGLNQLLARCVNGSVYAWGYNDVGQLGLGSGAGGLVSTPTVIPGLLILVP